MTLPVIALGGVGVISVISNQIPKMFTRFVHLCLEQLFSEAMDLERQLYPLMKANFIETNPIPVKAGLALMGMIDEVYRLPLVPMRKENKERLRLVMAELNLIQS
jgi:4-hydroxy-tetrahydrodipicolinate synthase